MSESSNLPRLVHSDGRETVLTGQLIIGRVSECSLQIEDDRASRRHARVEVIGQRVMLSDLDSHNGTWVNDQKITAPAELHDGDHIRIGRTVVTFKAAIIPPQDEPAQPPVILKEGGKTTSWLTTEPMTLVRGNDGAEFGLNRSMRIGHDEINELALKADTSASQFHAVIELLDGQVVISDLKSHNGTWVNGKRITAPAILKHGDKIRLGDTVLRLRVGDRSLPPLDVEVGPSKARRLGYGSLSVGGFAVVIVLMLGLLIVWPSIRDIFKTPTAIPISNTAVVEVGVTQTTQTAVADVEATQAAARQNALRALVQVQVPAYYGDIKNWDGKGPSGSGSMLNEKGIVLTNFHVIGDNETGKYYNPDGLIFIGLNLANPQASPDEFYRCEVVKGNPELDLAVLRVVDLFNSKTKAFDPLPDDLSFAFIPIGDSDELNNFDPITIIGFPSAGEDTPTSTTGIVAGFLFLPDGNTPEWIKTDAETNPGNSGGMAINQNGELIGVPSMLNSAIVQDPGTGSERIVGKISFIRPINLAIDLIKSACPECPP